MKEVKKGDILVWCDDNGITRDFFIATKSEEHSMVISNNPARYYINHLLGYRINSNIQYNLGHWAVDRHATKEERELFFSWLREKGLRLNVNTCEFIHL